MAGIVGLGKACKIAERDQLRVLGTGTRVQAADQGMGFAQRIEKRFRGLESPAKLKLAVSGCPRNCAEATCKDVGVVCVDSGYEIHFAGAAGLHISATLA